MVLSDKRKLFPLCEAREGVSRPQAIRDFYSAMTA